MTISIVRFPCNQWKNIFIRTFESYILQNHFPIHYKHVERKCFPS